MAYRESLVYLNMNEFILLFERDRSLDDRRTGFIKQKNDAHTLCRQIPHACRKISFLDVAQLSQIHLYVTPSSDRCDQDEDFIVDRQKIYIGNDRFPYLRNITITLDCMKSISYKPIVERTLYPCGWFLVRGIHLGLFIGQQRERRTIENRCHLDVTTPIFRSSHATWLVVHPSRTILPKLAYPRFQSMQCQDHHHYRALWSVPSPTSTELLSVWNTKMKTTFPVSAVNTLHGVHSYGVLIFDSFSCAPPIDGGHDVCDYDIGGTTDPRKAANCLPSFHCVEFYNDLHMDAIIPLLYIRDAPHVRHGEDLYWTVSISRSGGNVAFSLSDTRAEPDPQWLSRTKVFFLKTVETISPSLVFENCGTTVHKDVTLTNQALMASFNVTDRYSTLLNLYSKESNGDTTFTIDSLDEDVNNEYYEVTEGILNSHRLAYGDFFFNVEYLMPNHLLEKIGKERSLIRKQESLFQLTVHVRSQLAPSQIVLWTGVSLLVLSILLSAVTNAVFMEPNLNVWTQQTNRMLKDAQRVGKQMVDMDKMLNVTTA